MSRTEATALSSEPIDDAMDPYLTQPEETPRSGPLKFTYSNGARPLVGYTIKRGIGRGGFGEVYFAVSDGGKEVALKLIRHNLEVELRGVAHCLNLKHPNLIALYDVKQDEQENSWVVMEYAVGESLEELLDRCPNGIPAEEAFDWMQGIGAGVAYLHDHGIVHRDLKPGNIFRDDGQVKLGDYGLSKFISCSRRSGQTESIGTVHYMAPEVANGRYGKEIDIYALGIILYEMLTGQVPFEGESVGEVLMKHLTAEPTLDKVPQQYRQVIARALAKDPTTRYRSVAEMFNALPPLAKTMAYRPPIGETRYPNELPPAEEQPDNTQQDSGAGPVNPPQPNSQPSGNAPQQPYAGAQQAGYQPQAQAAMAGLAGFAAAGVGAAGEDEPVWRAVRDGWRNARDSWDGLNTPTKVVVAVVGCSALAYNAELVLRLIVPTVILYVLYRVVRAVVLQHDQQKAQHAAGNARYPQTPRYPGAPQAPNNLAATAYHPTSPRPEQPPSPPGNPVPPGNADANRGDWRAASQRHWKRKSRKHRRHEAVQALVVKSGRERVADLAGSMILAAIVGTIMSVVAVLLRGETNVEQNQFAWLTLTSVLGSWAVLIPSALWAGTNGDATLRRVTMLVVGLLVGAVAYVGSTTLLVQFTDSAEVHNFVQLDFGKNFYDAKGAPLLGAYLAYFGAMFAGIRWWRQADPLRRTRLSVWNIGAAVMGAWVVDWIWRFPQPWGLMVAAIISTSVQLAAPQSTLPEEKTEKV
jgi:serine/threonine protein kinase